MKQTCEIAFSALSRVQRAEVFTMIGRMSNVDADVPVDRFVDRVVIKVRSDFLSRTIARTNQLSELEEAPDTPLPEGMVKPMYAGQRPVEKRV